MTRIVVSGLGVVSPYGAGVKTFWAGLAAGTCAIRPITLIETDGFRSRIAAEVPADGNCLFAPLHGIRPQATADTVQHMQLYLV